MEDSPERRRQERLLEFAKEADGQVQRPPPSVSAGVADARLQSAPEGLRQSSLQKGQLHCWGLPTERVAAQERRQQSKVLHQRWKKAHLHLH